MAVKRSRDNAAASSAAAKKDPITRLKKIPPMKMKSVATPQASRRKSPPGNESFAAIPQVVKENLTWDSFEVPIRVDGSWLT